MLIPVAYGATIPILEKVKTQILNPFISLLFLLAIAYFMYGLVEYIWKAGDASARSAGRQHMIWGVVGLTIMISVWGLIRLVTATVQMLGT